MKILALALLAAPAFAAPTPTPLLATGASTAGADASLQAILDGKTGCRASDARALVYKLERLSTTTDAASLTGAFDHVCGRKTGAYWFKSKGAIAQDVRETFDAVWLESASGSLVRNAEMSERLTALAAEYRAAKLVDPSGEAPTTREFTLITDRPGAWRTEWAGPDGGMTIVVNEGDYVALKLVNNMYSQFEYAHFQIDHYGSVMIGVTFGGAREVRPFLADKAGTFEFYNPRSLNRAHGKLIVLPR